MAFPWEANEPWAVPDSEAAEPDESDPIDYDNFSPGECGDELFNLLVELKKRGSLSAKHVCVLSFWASRAGAVGPIGILAKKPSVQSGQFSAHFDRATKGNPKDARDWYELPTPRYIRCDVSRSVDDLSVLVPHESIADEILGKPGMRDLLEKIKCDGTLQSCYFDHPVVASEKLLPVYPLALYCDGVAFARHDNVLGFWIYNLATQSRHCFVALRKSELCACGCRGWCSIHMVWMLVAWSLRAMIEGKYPTTRHDGTPWQVGVDDHRDALKGKPLGWKAILLFVKADLQEYGATMGLPGWKTSLEPCMLCHCTAQTLYELAGYTPVSMPFADKTLDEHNEACSRCEIKLVLNKDQRTKVRAALVFDRRNHGNHGRCLVLDFDDLGLMKGDRLEPTPEMPDIMAFDTREPPVRCCFWRASTDTLARHRSPLFAADLHVSPNASFQIDWLHTLSLGIFQDYGAALMGRLFDANVWKCPGNIDARIKLSVGHIENDLFAFYAAEAKAGRNHSRVQRLDYGMFVKGGAYSLSLHGSETNGFLCFAVSQLVERFKLPLGADYKPLAKLGLALVQIKSICDLDPPDFDQRVHVQETATPSRPPPHRIHNMATIPLSACITSKQTTLWIMYVFPTS
jgi:hypothetical protein